MKQTVEDKVREILDSIRDPDVFGSYDVNDVAVQKIVALIKKENDILHEGWKKAVEGARRINNKPHASSIKGDVTVNPLQPPDEKCACGQPLAPDHACGAYGRLSEQPEWAEWHLGFDKLINNPTWTTDQLKSFIAQVREEAEQGVIQKIRKWTKGRTVNKDSLRKYLNTLRKEI